MRNLLITSVALSIILGIFQWMFFGDVTAPASATSTWQRDLDEALEEGRRFHRPVLALLTRDDSQAAQRFESEVMGSPIAQMATKPFVAVRLDAAAHPQYLKRLHADGMPWIVIYNDEGREVDSFVPSADADDFAAHLARAYNAH